LKKAGSVFKQRRDAILGRGGGTEEPTYRIVAKRKKNEYKLVGLDARPRYWRREGRRNPEERQNLQTGGVRRGNCREKNFRHTGKEDPVQKMLALTSH